MNLHFLNRASIKSKTEMDKINPYKTEFFRELGEVNIEALKARIDQLSVQFWEDQNAQKPNKFGALGSTRHIVFRFINSFKDHRFYSDSKLWEDWEEVLSPILNSVATKMNYSTAEFPRVMLAKLPAKESIKAHIDASPAAQFPHKIHVPITTNDQTYFCFEKSKKQMKVGEAYEVNNNIKHWAENKGNTDRIHLIFELFSVN
tara:strand:- start:5485 stop:6093 length:609 start_codon:yes stop_codon:yes gene_type:complete